jgi:hypothetical protein
VLLSAPTHPWPANPGWYNKLAVRPLIGELFLRTCVYPLGLLLANGSSRSVFEPQTVPENYVRRAAILMVLRPKNFYSNALDLVFLERFITTQVPRYADLRTPHCHHHRGSGHFGLTPDQRAGPGGDAPLRKAHAAQGHWTHAASCRAGRRGCGN